MQIRTQFICPPIPSRNYDWMAIDTDTYDAEFVGGENDEWRGGPIGHGPTEEEAIADLLEQLGVQI